jgi:catechol 2,3-dioxygenase-like lactoylglutathione lyase family enzyme
VLDHLGITASDFGRSSAFYRKALEPLAIVVIMELSAAETGSHAHIGFGRNGKPFFWIGDGSKPCGSVHIAFTSPDRRGVDAFYRAALAAGGRDNGPPGIRAYYHPNYYGAFVLDPDGNNVEAVCHGAE